MRYKVERDLNYDFINQSYSSFYPNLHRYPATMLPQIGIKLIRDFNVKKGKLLDPYCGSGSSFTSGLECGIDEMDGFDINPLAILISKAKFTKVDTNSINKERMNLRSSIFEFLKNENNFDKLDRPQITNVDFWFSKEVIQNINILRHFISKINDDRIKTLFLVPFSETVRECSYTRNKEFKLFKMKEEEVLNFKPDVINVFFEKLNHTISTYSSKYLPKLSEKTKIRIDYSRFKRTSDYYDVVLTSPPYGDSKTTVAYGQFSRLSNEWMGIDHAKKIDATLMGGKKSKILYKNGIIADYVNEISKQDNKRALEVSAFCDDLENSIQIVSESVKNGGKVFYIVGNRKVKNVELPTDQFIAEKFEENGFKHIVTIKRALSSKVMPSKNSPTNIKGKLANTMLFEQIVVCEK